MSADPFCRAIEVAEEFDATLRRAGGALGVCEADLDVMEATARHAAGEDH